MASKKPSPSLSPFSDDSWRAKDDMRILGHAQEIQYDPKRLAAAKKEAQAELKKVSMILGKKPSMGKRK
jgi:hypothetical protein